MYRWDTRCTISYLRHLLETQVVSREGTKIINFTQIYPLLVKGLKGQAFVAIPVRIVMHKLVFVEITQC